MKIVKIKTQMKAGDIDLGEKDMWTSTCVYCGKVIVAYTRNQVKFRMGIHHGYCKRNKNRKVGGEE